ncbi:MAG: HyaD/HybD family hydrogenase maturation endopeptidase [Nitrospirae bacterium]|nr:HyaD/HybD family hydrogenase maturation endopeptidase [Nitrospirota bacterium]
MTDTDNGIHAGPGDHKVMILGVGNILLKDEGFGVRVVERMRDTFSFPDNVELMDGGTAGLDLLPFVEGFDRLVIIDTVNAGEPPGSIFRFTPDDITVKVPYKTSLHQIGMVEVFAIAEALGRKMEAVIIGIQPEDMHSLGLELTDTLQAKVPEVIGMVLKELELLGVKVEKKNRHGDPSPQPLSREERGLY